MYFTQEDYKKIENWLHRNSVKDTEFQEALPFTGKEIVTVVQDGHNRKVNIQEFINQLYKHGVEDFLNVTNTYRANNITLKEAIRLIPAEARKEGQVITFLNTEGNWEIYQFTGKLNQWNNPTLWNNPFDWEKFVVDSILPDEEDLTKSAPDANGNAYLSLKNRKYEPDKYSGLGRKILRRRVVEIEDPVYGTQEKNLLLQADFAEDNTVYVVRYDFTLNGQDITLPDNSYIEYEGGSISDGNIIDRAGGLNRVVLKKNIVNGKNILTQEMVSKSNTIYEIRYDFTLGEDVTIPNNCVLKFDGGSISGAYTITGSNTGILAGLVKIFDTNIILNGVWSVKELPVEWFGAKGNGITDDTVAIQKALDMAGPTYSKIMDVKLLISHTYKITDTLKIGCFTNFGSSSNLSDNRLNGDDSIAIIKQTVNKDALMICEEGYFTDPSRIKIYGIHFIGYDKYANSAISTESGVSYLTMITFEKITFRKFKFGINLQNDESKVNSITCIIFRNIRCQTNEVGIPVYIKAAYYCYDTKFYDCYFSFTYIKGVHIEVKYNITAPITFEGCLIEACGREYRLNDILEYGGGAITVRCQTKNDGSPSYKTDQFSQVDITNCYFEDNSPFRTVDGSYDSENEQIYTFGNNSYYGIKETNPLKASELVFDTCSAYITGTPISYTYMPPISLSYAGGITFKDNKLFHQKAVPSLYKSLIYLNTLAAVGCSYMYFDIDASNISKSAFSSCQLNDSIKQIISCANNGGNFTGKLNFPAIDEITNYYYNNHILNNIVIYVDKDSSNNIETGYRHSPYKSLRNALIGPEINQYKDITIILLSDAYNNHYSVPNISAGKRITITSFNKKTIYFNNPQGQSFFKFVNDNITFDNITIRQDSTASFIGFDNCNVKIKNCNIILDTSKFVFVNYGSMPGKFEFIGCDISLGENVASGTLNINNDDAVVKTLFTNTTVPVGVKYINSELPMYASSHPSTDNLEVGANYFNTVSNKQLYWTGTAWVDATGATV